MNLAQFLVNSARAYPDRKAIRFEGAEITFRELDIHCNRLANALRDLGLAPGDRCLVMMPNSIERVVVYFALAKMGVVQVVVSVLDRLHELAQIVNDAKPKAFIGAEPYLEEIRKVFKTVDGPAIRLAKGVSANSEFIDLNMAYSARPEYPLYQADDDDVVNILYTSRTAGLPKGVMLTHKNLITTCKTVAEMHGKIDLDTVVIGVLPLHHIFGIVSLLNSSVYLGLTIELFNHFNSEKVLEVIECQRQTILFVLPHMVGQLIQVADERGCARNSLKFCVSEGSSLPVESLQRFESLFGASIYEGYGLTEAPNCFENPHEPKIKAGSIGLPVSEYRARVADNDNRDVPIGATGELLVKGPGVMKGYLNRPEDTAEVLKDGWLHTGDTVRMDDDGYVYIMNRRKDLMIRDSYTVHSHEIEEIMYRMPEVSEAAVAGMPRKDFGEEVQ